MNLISFIREKAKAVQIKRDLPGISAVLTHIERAEVLLNKAIIEGDSQSFSDVVYRTNHAYEGILREAYIVYKGKINRNIRTVDIEDYFLTENLLNQRIVGLLQNYRKNWRNPSTHDYQLFFEEKEAFLAITNVSSLVYVMLLTIIERIAFEEQKEAPKEPFQTKPENQPFRESIETLILEFMITLRANEIQVETESELHGRLSAFLHFSEHSFSILEDTDIESVSEVAFFNFDFVISNQTERAFIELKRFHSGLNKTSVMDQGISLCQNTGIENGFYILFTKDFRATKYKTETTGNYRGESKAHISVFSPVIDE